MFARVRDSLLGYFGWLLGWKVVIRLLKVVVRVMNRS